MMNQISARMDMLNPHQVEIQPKTQNRPEHRQQDQQQRLLRRRVRHKLRYTWVRLEMGIGHWALES
jgi:hypothetical protein